MRAVWMGSLPASMHQEHATREVPSPMREEHGSGKGGCGSCVQRCSWALLDREGSGRRNTLLGNLVVLMVTGYRPGSTAASGKLLAGVSSLHHIAHLLRRVDRVHDGFVVREVGDLSAPQRAAILQLLFQLHQHTERLKMERGGGLNASGSARSPKFLWRKEE